MKNIYFLLLPVSLLAGLPLVAVHAQVSLTGSSTLYIGPGGTVTSPGYLNVGAGTTLTNEGQLEVGGNLTNNGTVTTPTAAAALLRANGTAQQTLSGSSPLPLQNLTVSNPAGVTLNLNATLAGILTLTNGLVTIATATPLVLLPTAPDPLETNSARLVGPVTMAARSVGGGAFGPFLGLSMPAGGGNVGNITLTRVTGPAGVTTVNGNASVAVYWEVASSANGNPKRKMHFSWLGALDNGRNMAQATPWRSDAPYAIWQRAAGPTTDVSATSPRQYSPAAANTEDVVGRFTISDLNTPLPVELVEFTARRQGPDARLDWRTASEKNNAYFDVERSLDGLLFERVGRVAGQGSSTQVHDYQLVDAKVAQYGVPTLYYRLRQVDADGTALFSSVRAVAVESTTALLVSAWPNPSAGSGPHIRIEQPFAGPLTATLTDAAGRRLAEFRTTDRVSEEVLGAETRALSSGVYLLRVTTAGTSQVLKLVRE
ncbi:T9SS type A sorting domain-containing protein [Hymenobacter monticola]|uniref:T9SS type A sorting domain-containing protein n=1 Tax=Hymenobacter monticola TaxID=1705399 RepID=A0ABY4B3S3_9BACT|nr:T9SS type A sorting domain-containing protein [Hymenobacter monticola]UOE33798.1 T9SS type A sorting domain-containing protein [Hymenobacter monticola]